MEKQTLASSSESTTVPTVTPGASVNTGKTAGPVEKARGAVVPSLVASWLLAAYLLPNTILGSLSPFSVVAARAASQANPASVREILVLCTGVVFAWFLYFGHIRLQNVATGARQLWILTGIYFGLYMVDALFRSTGSSSGVWEAEAVIAAVCCGLLATRLCSTGTDARRMLCIVSVLQAGWALISFKAGFHASGAGGYAHPTGTFNDPQALAFLAVLSLPIAVTEALQTRSTWGIAFWGLATAILLGALFAVWDGRGLLAALFSLGFLAVISLKRARIATVIGLLFVALLLATVQRSSQLSLNLVLPARTLAQQSSGWQHALRMFRADLWIGVGLGRLKSPDSVVTVVGATTAQQIPDNLLLHWLLEAGVGGGLFLCLLVLSLVRVLRRREGEDAVTLQAQWIAVGSVSIFHAFFGSAERPVGMLLFTCLLGATLLPERLARLSVPEDVTADNTQRRLAPELFAVAAMLTLAAAFAAAALNRSRAGLPKNPVVTKLLPVSSTVLLQGRHDFLGSPAGPYTLVEFGDYECPPCRAAQSAVRGLLASYPNKIRLDYRNLPIVTLHAHAMYAAVVAAAARREGCFPEVHTVLFDAALDDPSIKEIATRYLKEGRLTSALTESGRRAVEADVALAQNLSIQGTPGFLLCCPDGKVYQVDSPEAAKQLLK